MHDLVLGGSLSPTQDDWIYGKSLSALLTRLFSVTSSKEQVWASRNAGVWFLIFRSMEIPHSCDKCAWSVRTTFWPLSDRVCGCVCFRCHCGIILRLSFFFITLKLPSFIMNMLSLSVVFMSHGEMWRMLLKRWENYILRCTNGKKCSGYYVVIRRFCWWNAIYVLVFLLLFIS